jgi:hypothetical protein
MLRSLLRHEFAQASSEAVDVGDGQRELGVAKRPGWLDPFDRAAEAQPNALHAAGGEGEPPIGQPETRRTRGLQECVGSGDRNVLDVVVQAVTNASAACVPHVQLPLGAKSRIGDR